MIFGLSDLIRFENHFIAYIFLIIIGNWMLWLGNFLEFPIIKCKFTRLSTLWIFVHSENHTYYMTRPNGHLQVNLLDFTGTIKRVGNPTLQHKVYNAALLFSKKYRFRLQPKGRFLMYSTKFNFPEKSAAFQQISLFTFSPFSTKYHIL